MSAEALELESGTVATTEVDTATAEPEGCSFDPIRQLRPDVPPPRRVAIVGFTQSYKDAPYGADGWELWGLNNLHLMPEVDSSKFHRWFDLHPPEDIAKDQRHVDWLKAGADGLPVYCWQPLEGAETMVPFPVDDVLARYPRYFTNSVSWMLALAIQEVAWAAHTPEGAEIAVYGINMSTGSEYSAQRPSCELFIGIAMGVGIKVTLPPTSDLLKAAVLYGVEADLLYLKHRERDAELRQTLMQQEQLHAQRSAEVRQIEANINTARGALDDNTYWMNVWHVAPVQNSTHHDHVKSDGSDLEKEKVNG